MVYGIILAAGSGSRMKTKEKKQFMKINGKTVVEYSIDKFLSIKNIGCIIIVINETDKDDNVIKYLIKKYKDEIYSEKINLILGGKERYDSVYSALNYIYDNYYIKKDDKVLIHDSARPNVDVKDIKKLITSLKKYKSCTLASKLTDTIKEVDIKKDIKVINTPDRSKYYLIKTPQGFNLRLLIDSYDRFYAYRSKNKKRKLNITDDLQIIESFSKEKSYIIDSSSLNYKITTKEDIDLLKYLL